MALKAILDSLDSVDASLHDLYREVDGKYVLQIEGIREHPETQALRNALDRVRKEKGDAAAELDALRERLGDIPDDFDADAYHELVERAEGGGDDGDVDGKIARVREQYDRKIAALEKKHETEVGKLNEANTKLRASMERNLIDGGLSAAMDEANIDPRHKKKLAPYLKAIGKIKLVEEDGEYSAIVETDMGEVPLSKFVSDWAGSDDGKEYVGKPTGLDAKGSDGRKIEGNPFAAASWNKTEQGRLISTDRAKAERFAKAAGFRSLDAAAAAREPVKTAA